MVWLIFIILMSFSQPSYSCKLSPSSFWNLSENELVAKAKNIYLVKVKDARHSLNRKKYHEFNYEFEVLETLNGSVVSTFNLEGFASPGLASEENVAHFGKDFLPIVGFKSGGQYLIFNKVNNTKSFKSVKSKNDEWYVKTKALILKSKL